MVTLPAAVAYVLEVVSSSDPHHRYSASDLKCQALSKEDRNWVIGLFDGYGLRDLVRKWAATGRLCVQYGGARFELDGSNVGTWTDAGIDAPAVVSGPAGAAACNE